MISRQRIVCVRHGRPTLRYSATPWRWITAGEMNRLLDAYDDAGLEPQWNQARVDLQLSEYALSSDLPRAIETAELYTGKKRDSIEQSPLLREVSLGRFRWLGLRLPTWVLLTMARVGWFFGLLPAGETRSGARARLLAAADLIQDRVEQHGAIAVYAHGFFLWWLGRELHRRGWHSSKKGRYLYLERAEFTREVDSR